MSRARGAAGSASPAADERAGLRPSRCVVSWSGGKDSALALRRALGSGLEVAGLLTIFSPETGTSRSHGLPRALLEEQARSLAVPLHGAHASWSRYEDVFVERLSGLAAGGIDVAVFGDIFLDDHRVWVERICAKAGVTAFEPLWGADTGRLAREIIGLGIEALVCTVRRDHLDEGWLGQRFDARFVDHLEERGLDPCGEHGEFHTVVVAGPGRQGRLVIDAAKPVSSDHYGHWVIDAWHRERGGPSRHQDDTPRADFER